jgi:hypothetical protein
MPTAKGANWPWFFEGEDRKPRAPARGSWSGARMTLRWTFPDPGEAAARAEVDAAIDAWWQALASARDRLVPQVDQSFDLVGFVAQHLLTIHSNLKWELRPGASHRWCFVVTAEEDRHLEPLVMRIISRAPPQLGFEVATQRAPESVSMALATVQGRFGVDASDWTVEFGPAQLGFLNVCWRGAASPEAAVCLMKCLVGERAVMDWVGNVDVARPSLRAKLFRGSRTGVSEFAAAFEAHRLVGAPCAAAPAHGSRGNLVGRRARTGSAPARANARSRVGHYA